MVIFNSYVKLPEGKSAIIISFHNQLSVGFFSWLTFSQYVAVRHHDADASEATQVPTGIGAFGGLDTPLIPCRLAQWKAFFSRLFGCLRWTYGSAIENGVPPWFFTFRKKILDFGVPYFQTSPFVYVNIHISYIYIMIYCMYRYRAHLLYI